MKRPTLEDRVSRLERLINSKQKNEFLGFGKPKRSDEPAFTNKLFNKYPTIGKVLHTSEAPTKTGEKQQFHLVLTADDAYNNVSFIISGPDRNNMYCTAFDKNNLKIDTLKPFSLDKDVNTVAKFILEILQNNRKRQYEKRARKLEAVSLSGMDCESIRQDIEDSLSDEYDSGVVVEVDSKYANLGIVVVGIYNPDLIAEYTITADDIDSFKTEYNGKVVGTISNSLNTAKDNLIDHFLDNFIE